MGCPAITTGTQFLSGVLIHIDCQARTIGSYGYGALADPRSPVAVVTTGLLALFVALHGLWLMFDGRNYAGRLVQDIIKIGIVLTLATSWPAWRVIAYDVVMNGPTEVANAIGLTSADPTNMADDVAQLQAVDDAMVVMTAYGSGRFTGGAAPEPAASGNSFEGIALADQFALGWGRSAFLIGIIAPFGVARLAAGLLLALAPLVAGLSLFGATLGIFVGWARALTFCALGSLAQYLVRAVEISLITPWIQSAISDRQGGVLTPSAPTELFVMTLSFSLINLGVLTVLGRMAFHHSISTIFPFGDRTEQSSSERQNDVRRSQPDQIMMTRAQYVAESVSNTVRQERMMRPRSDLLRDSTARETEGGAVTHIERSTSGAGGRAAAPQTQRSSRNAAASVRRRDAR